MNVRDFAIIVNPYDLYYGRKAQIIGVQTDFYGKITGYTAQILNDGNQSEYAAVTMPKKKHAQQCDLKDYPAIDLHYYSSHFWRRKPYSQMQLL